MKARGRLGPHVLLADATPGEAADFDTSTANVNAPVTPGDGAEAVAAYSALQALVEDTSTIPGVDTLGIPSGGVPPTPSDGALVIPSDDVPAVPAADAPVILGADAPIIPDDDIR